MTEVNADQRARAKTAAANAAVAANDTAVVLGAGGAVVALAGVASGVGALAGVGVGAVLAVCSFGAWWVGNRYQRLANDPPRDDFDQVTVSTAAVVEEALPADEPDATASRMAAEQLVLADAVAALVTSLERYDGASQAGDQAAADSQADAVAQNAAAVEASHGRLADIAAALNEAWTATIPTVDWSAVSIGQAQQAYLDAIGDPQGAPGAALSNAVAGVANLDFVVDIDPSSHPLFSAGDLGPEPDGLVSSQLLDAQSQLSEPLPNIVASGVG